MSLPPDGHDVRRLSLSLAFLAASVAANAAAPGHKCKYSRIAELPVWIERGRPVTEGSVNGQKVDVLLDTGAARSLIHRSAVAKLGLIPLEVTGYRMFGVGGETSAQAVHIDEFRFGQSVRKNWRVLVGGEHERADQVIVFLGYDFFQNVDVEFDLPNDAVRLYEAADCENVSLSYWATEPAGQAALESHSKPEVMIRINGQPARALLDSGATSSVIEMDLASRVGVTPQSPGVVPGGCSFGLGKQPVESWIAQFESFAIGNEIIRNPRIRFADLWKHVTYTETGSRVPRHLEGLPSMLLGADFFRAHRVLIAHSQRKIYFSHTGGAVFPATPSRGCSPRP